jgi:Fic family protein
LKAFEEKHLNKQIEQLIESFDQDALRRATSYLYTKETRSSFSIEGETITQSRADRFAELLKSLPKIQTLDESTLAELQSVTVDPRFAVQSYRSETVYVGENIDFYHQKIHYIAPKPEDVLGLMSGLLKTLYRLEGSELPAVVQAAMISFGFVFIHPFPDGNGRLHRMLIHYILERNGFTPKGVIFPVSAIMERRRSEYDAVLETFSVPLMKLIDYDVDENGTVHIMNETERFYRYFDATQMAEALYEWIEATIQEDFQRELKFVRTFREIRKAVDDIVEMPDNKAESFIRLCLQNKGVLSNKKRHFFDFLTDEELRALEKAVQSHLDGF